MPYLNSSVHCELNSADTKIYNLHIYSNEQGELNRRRGRQGFRTLCCDVFGLLKNQFLRNNNNKGSRSNVNKHELVYGESSSTARDEPDVCLYHLCYCLQSLLLLLRKNQLFSSPKTSQQSVRKPYCPLLLFNISLRQGMVMKTSF